MVANRTRPECRRRLHLVVTRTTGSRPAPTQNSAAPGARGTLRGVSAARVTMFRPKAVPFDVYTYGIPPAERASRWMQLSGAADKRDAAGEGYYQRLVEAEAPEGDRAQIKKVRVVWKPPTRRHSRCASNAQDWRVAHGLLTFPCVSAPPPPGCQAKRS